MIKTLIVFLLAKGEKMKNEIRFFTVQEIADLLGVSQSSIQRWADSNKLQCEICEGGNRRFSEKHLQEFSEKYNISMKFLSNAQSTKSNATKGSISPIAVAQ